VRVRQAAVPGLAPGCRAQLRRDPSPSRASPVRSAGRHAFARHAIRRR